MKLASFLTPQGAAGYGAVLPSREVVDLSGALPDTPDLAALLAAMPVEQIVDRARALSARWQLDDLQLLPVIPNPRKIICVGLNYLGHIRETGRPVPEHPPIFTRFADTLISHGQDAALPEMSTHFDYEGELAVVIGRPAWRVAIDDAMSAVAGYTCFNDFSVRDWQFHTSQYTPGKNFPGTGALGPFLTPAADAGPVASLQLVTRVNGEERQNASLSELGFGIEELIAYISAWTALSPGDVIATGTPSGVASAQKPPRWLRHGDVVTVDITGLGQLRNVVRAEDA